LTGSCVAADAGHSMNRGLRNPYVLQLCSSERGVLCLYFSRLFHLLKGVQMTAQQGKLVRGSYERLALGFVGLCVAGLYSAVVFSPVKPATYTVELDGVLQDENGRLASAEVYSIALPSVSEPLPVMALASVESVQIPLPVAIPAAPEKTASSDPVVPETASVAISVAIIEAEPRAPKPGLKPRHVARRTLATRNATGAPIQFTHAAAGLSVRSASKLEKLFSTLGYRLDRVRSGEGLVPRIFLASLPRDLKSVNSISKRKAVFLKTMLPLILIANENVLTDRRRLFKLKAATELGATQSLADRLWLEKLAKSYGVEASDFGALVARVDAVPPSLALAQAVEESGWGTSRFAQEGNAPFGQWTYDESKGLVPSDRDEGASHAVKVYGHLREGVQAYVHNLNTHRAYAKFRKVRENMRAKDGDLKGYDLAGTLERYSQRGHEYVETLRLIMWANDLMTLDQARLNGAEMARLAMSEN